VEDNDEEKEFRTRYAEELKKKKQEGGRTDLEDERTRVKHQQMKTPGRRGEQIKHEEIDREFVRRYVEKQQKEKAKKKEE